jgi:hypothetical protein
MVMTGGSVMGHRPPVSLSSLRIPISVAWGQKGLTSLASVVSQVSSSHLAGDFVFQRKSLNERSF